MMKCILLWVQFCVTWLIFLMVFDVECQYMDLIQTIAGNGTSGYSTNRPATSVMLYSPIFILGDTIGNLFVADNDNHAIRKIDVSTKVMTTIAGRYYTYNADNVQGTSTYLAAILTMWLDSLGAYLYFAEYDACRVRRLQLSTSIITVFAGTISSASCATSGNGGPATSAGLSPFGVSGDTAGGIYIADSSNCCVRKVTNNIISTIAGTGVSQTSGDGGYATNANLVQPYHVVVDTIGNVYISDQSAHRVRKIDYATQIITTIAGTGTPSYSGDGGAAISAKIYGPRSLFLTTTNILYFADKGNHCIRKVSLSTGIITLVAGKGGTSGFSGDEGPATSALLYGPHGVWMNSLGVIYIADWFNNRIRKVETVPVPTIQPTKAPTTIPTAFPTAIPTKTPTACPTTIPTMSPTAIPTISPTIVPTPVPSTAPSTDPTAFPTAVPSFRPTRQPITLEVYESSIHRIYPPEALLNYETAITSREYGNGIYSITSSGFNGSSIPVYAFDYTTNSVYVTNPSYSVIDGKYLGTMTTTASNGIKYTGEYIQLTLPDHISLTAVKIAYRNDYIFQTRSLEFTILGSNDNGVGWDLISTWTTSSDIISIPNGDIMQLYNCTEDLQMYYTTFRVIVTSIGYYSPATRSPTYQPTYQPSLTRSPTITRLPTITPSTRAPTGGITLLSIEQIYFNGSYHEYIGTLSFQTTNYFSIAMWIKPMLYSNTIATISRTPTDISNEFVISIEYDGKLKYFEYDGNYGIELYSNTVLAMGKYTHIVFIKNDKIGSFYIDGKLDSTVIAGYSISIASNYFNLGNDYRDKDHYFNGYMNSIIVHNYALTASQITTLANTPYLYSWECSGLQFIGIRSDDDQNVDKTDILFVSDIVGTGSNTYNGDNIDALSVNLNGPTAIYPDFDGSLYISDNNNHRICRVDGITNIITTYAGSGLSGLNGDGGFATSATLYNPNGLWVSSIGTVYVADTNNHRVRAIDLDGIISTIAGYGIVGYANGYSGDNGPGTSATIGYVYGIIGDSNGNLYWTDCTYHVVRKLSTAGIVTLYAGTGTAGYSAADEGNDAALAMLNGPRGIGLDSFGNIFIMDTSNHLIRKIDCNTTLIITVAGSGSDVFTDGPALAAGIMWSENLWIDTSDNVYFADYDAKRIRMLNVSIDEVITIAGTGISTTIADGALGSNGIGQPLRMWGDSNGYIYFYDQFEYNYGIFRLRLTDNTLMRITRYADYEYSDGVAATMTQVGLPSGLYIDPSTGLMYVGTYGRICVINTLNLTEPTYALIGDGYAFFTGDKGPASSAQIGYVYGIWSNTQGNLYVLDGSNYHIRKIDTSGIIDTIVGSGYGGYSGYNGDGKQASMAYLTYPFDVKGDSNGALYIADTGNNVIRKIESDGIISTIAGGHGYTSSLGDGDAATLAYLSEPRSIYVATDGRLFIADYGNHRIRKVSNIGQIITTVAGYSEVTNWGDGNLATSSSLRYPRSVWLSTDGYLYIADFSNHRIRRVDKKGIINTVVGQGLIGYGQISTTDNVEGTSIYVRYPFGVCYDSISNTIYVGGDAAHRIYSLSLDTNIVKTFAGGGSNYANNITATSTSIAYAHFVTTDTNGDVYYTEDRYVRKVTYSTGIVVTLAGNGGYTDGDEYIEGPGNNIGIKNAFPITVQTIGAVYYADLSNIIRKIDSLGNVSTIAGTGTASSTRDGEVAKGSSICSAFGLFADTIGNIFFSESECHKVRYINSSGLLNTIAGNGYGSYSWNDEGNYAIYAYVHTPRGVWCNSMGDVYIADADNHRIRMVDHVNLSITTLVGNGECSIDVSESLPLLSLSICYPMGIWGESSGNYLFITEHWNHRVRKVDLVNNIAITIIGHGMVGLSGYTSGPIAGTSCWLNGPTSIVADTTGTMYIAEAYNNHIKKLYEVAYPTSVPTSQPTTVVEIATGQIVAGTGVGNFAGDNGPATSADIYHPISMVLNTVNDLYFTDSQNHRVRKVDYHSTLITTIAGTGDTDFCGDGGPAISACFDTPYGLWLSTNGVFYVGDRFHYRIRMIDNAMIITTFAGSGVTGYSGDGGPATQASISSSESLFGDSLGQIYICDSENNVVRMVSVGGIISTIIGGGGSSSAIGDGAEAINAYLSFPIDGFITTDGNIYITEYTGQRVRKVDVSGIISTVAGTGSVGYSGEGLAATDSMLSSPWGVYVSTDGSIYLSDRDNACVRKVNSRTGRLYTVAGVCGNGGDGKQNLIASKTLLNYPTGLQLDTVGNMYVSEYLGNSIRRFTIVDDWNDLVLSSAYTGYSLSGYIDYDGISTFATFDSALIAAKALYPKCQGITQFDATTFTIYASAMLTASSSTTYSWLLLLPAEPSSQPSSSPTCQPSSQPTQPTSQPTHRPTLQPTRQPSTQPSGRPTRRPSRQPTSRPSIQPTCQPSSRPSNQPTIQPTSKPTRQPTNQPSSQPSYQPTSQPSQQPTNQPSQQPSTQPSRHPTSQPSCQPTRSPTAQPLSMPSCQPSTQPSLQPSSLPSTQPTIQPTGNPSSQPSQQPSSKPSQQPTSIPSLQPSCSPSSQPSALPSSSPTSQPSYHPTSQPTKLPTRYPSAQPSSQPSSRPSVHPSSQPLGKPTGQPSAQPSPQPSCCPTSQPTLLPSQQPTNMPTRQPSSQPSTAPSKQPTLQPSAMPSCVPTVQPSSLPTTIPSNQPLSSPTTQPSSQPSKQPSGQPSVSPSVQPTCYPSSQPLNSPSAQPTCQPSCQPSSFPSCQPLGSPSSQPTMQPTHQPTQQPSGQPSSQPTFQPTFHPSDQPTCQPSMSPSVQPTSNPSSQPTMKPSNQPSCQPSSVPTKQPQAKPTGQPTIQPSVQPSVQPSSAPSALPSGIPTNPPTSQPTLQPIGHPSSQPTLQPSSLPSSQPSIMPTSMPTAYPTIDKDKCLKNTYYVKEDNVCYNCPFNSSQPIIGSVSCICDAGFRQIGESKELQCIICPAGSFSTPGNASCYPCSAGYYSNSGSAQCTSCPAGTYSTSNASVCTPCAPGYYSNVEGQYTCAMCSTGSFASAEGTVECTLCPQGFYSDQQGQSSCLACAKGEITPGVGSNSNIFCVNPTPNFAIGGVTLGLGLVMIYIYLTRGRLHNIAFERKALYIAPLAHKCAKLQTKLDRELIESHRNMQYRQYRFSQRVRVLLFLLSAFMIIILMIICQYMLLFYKAFYNALFIVRGLSGIITLPPLLPSIQSILMDVAEFVSLPLIIVDIIFYPAFAIVSLIQSININLDTINVTCEGSKAPAELIINFMILGVVISILMSGYQYLWLITFPNLTISLLKKDLLTKQHQQQNDFNYSIHSATNWNAFLCILGVGIMYINPFEGIIRYLLTFVTIHRFFTYHGMHPVTDSCNTIGGMKNVDLLLGVSSSLVAWWLIMPFLYILSEVLVPHVLLRNREILRLPHEEEFLQQRKAIRKIRKRSLGSSAFTAIVPDPNHDDELHHLRTKRQPEPLNAETVRRVKERACLSIWWSIISLYCTKAFKTLRFLVSIDIAVISIAHIWLSFLGRSHGETALQQLDYDTSDDEDDIDQSMTQNSQTVTWWSSIKERIMLTKHARVHDIRQKRLQYAKQELQNTRISTMSTYNELCILVALELWEHGKATEFMATLLAWSGFGHWWTQVGRLHWTLVGRRYYCFGCACFGIWTDDVVDSYKLDEIATSLYIGNSSSDAERYDTYRSLLYINVGMRAMVLQVFPVLNIVSIGIAAFASTPLYIVSTKLKNKLPDIIMHNARDIAMEIHFYANGIDSANNYQWLLQMSTFAIFITKSRLFVFISSLLAICIPILALHYTRQSRIVLILVLIALLPFIIGQALNVLVIVGKQVGVTDTDFEDVYYDIVWLLTCGHIKRPIVPAGVTALTVADVGATVADEMTDAVPLPVYDNTTVVVNIHSDLKELPLTFQRHDFQNCKNSNKDSSSDRDSFFYAISSESSLVLPPVDSTNVVDDVGSNDDDDGKFESKQDETGLNLPFDLLQPDIIGRSRAPSTSTNLSSLSSISNVEVKSSSESSSDANSYILSDDSP